MKRVMGGHRLHKVQEIGGCFFIGVVGNRAHDGERYSEIKTHLGHRRPFHFYRQQTRMVVAKAVDAWIDDLQASVAEVRGSELAVVGLPLRRLAELLLAAGVALPVLPDDIADTW